MKKGPQTVPAVASMLSGDTDVGLSSYVPDFDVFLNDCEVPSPSNMYANSPFAAEPPDYVSLLGNGGGGIDNSSSAYAKFHQASSPSDLFYDSAVAADQKPSHLQQQQHQHQQMHSPATESSPYGSGTDYNQRLEDFGTSLLYDMIESTHLDLFAASILGSTGRGVSVPQDTIKKEVMSDDETMSCTPAPPRRQQQQQQSTTTPIVIKTEVMDDQDECCSIGEDGGDFEKVVLQQLAEDIEVACDTLHISADPYKWTMENVHSWLMWTLRQYNLPQISLEYFLTDGPTLCSLSEDTFRHLTPQNGDILYAQLEIWKTAASFKRDRTTATTTPSQPPAYKTEDMNSYVAFSSPQSSVMDSRSVSPVQLNSPPAACVPDLGVISHHGYNSDAATQSDDEISVDGVEGVDKVDQQTASARIHGTGTGTSHSHIHLWQFLKELLINQQTHNGTCIRWLDRNKGVFKIEDSVRVARLWGKRKNRPAMNYDKLSRSIRQYYKKGIMKKTERSQRLVYQFCHPYCL